MTGMIYNIGKLRLQGALGGAVALWAVVCFSSPVRAEICPAEKFGAAVDHSGASLRAFNAEAQPKLNERIKALKQKKGWADEGYEEKAYDYLQNERMAGFDAHSNELLIKIDTLGQKGEKGGVDCSALEELQAAGNELLEVMKAKSAYMLERIDAETGTMASAAPPQPAASEKTDTPPAQSNAVGKKPDTATAKPGASSEKSWSTKTTAAEPPPPAVSDAYVPPSDPAALPLPPKELTTDESGYTIDEIRDATRGFFGTISTNLASVIEHTFSIAGRPTGYVLGQEGGGAFLAGLRYGDGQLYMRTGGTQRVFWHGPTIGADIGAAGSRTLFLIYKMKEPADIYRSFTGLDGSAYFVGGVGVTLMKGGKVIMAPIRSGLGLRLGANIGYVRFTDRPTWNPF